jgi:hypothetical protein
MGCDWGVDTGHPGIDVRKRCCCVDAMTGVGESQRTFKLAASSTRWQPGVRRRSRLDFLAFYGREVRAPKAPDGCPSHCGVRGMHTVPEVRQASEGIRQGRERHSGTGRRVEVGEGGEPETRPALRYHLRRSMPIAADLCRRASLRLPQWIVSQCCSRHRLSLAIFGRPPQKKPGKSRCRAFGVGQSPSVIRATKGDL